MRIIQMREYLIGMYPKSWRWREQVKKMSDTQVVAIMMRIRLQEKPRKKQ